MIKKTIGKNLKYSALSQGLIFLLNFILFPFIVSHVGKEIYGAYLLVMTFTGYLGIFDFGVGSALIKYVAEAFGRQNIAEAKKVINSSFTFYFFIGILSSLILLALSFSFDSILNTGPVHKIFIQRLFWVAAASSLFIWPGRTFDSVLQGLQKYDVISIFNSIFSAFVAIAAYVIFSRGMGMGWFLAVSYICIAIKYVIFYFIVRNKGIVISFPYFDRAIFSKIFSFSIFLFFSNIVGLIIFNFDNFVIGAFVSVSAVTVYGVGYIFQNGFRSINSLLGGPLFPVGSDMEGRNEIEKQKILFLKGTKYMTLFFVPLIIITLFFTEIIINNWMGGEFQEGVLPAQILMFFWIFNNTLEVGSGLLVAKGYVKERFKFDVLNAVFNLSLSLILVRYFGILGVALGTTIPMVLIYFPLVLSLILKVLGLIFSEFFNFTLKKNILVYFFSIAASLFSMYLYQPSNLLFIAIEMFIVYFIVILVGFTFTLSKAERQELLNMVR